MGSNEIQILSYCTSGISTYSNSTAFFFLTTFYSHSYRLITLVLLCFVGQSIIFILIAQSEHLFDSIIFFFCHCAPACSARGFFDLSSGGRQEWRTLIRERKSVM